MNEHDEIWQIRRGRPKKLLHDDCMKLNAFFKQSLPPVEQAYRTAKTQYLKDSYSIVTENLIRETLSLANVPLKDKHLPLLIIAQEGVKQMLASDIEVIVFSMIFLRQNLADLTITLEEFVKICIFLAKMQIESDLELITVIKARLEEEITDFNIKLNFFNSDEIISTRDILRWNRRLNNCQESCINYSFYVDDILLKAPPYKISEKNNKIVEKGKQKKGNKKRRTLKGSKKNPPRSRNENKFNYIFPKNKRRKAGDLKAEEMSGDSGESDEYWWPEKDNEYGLDDLV